MNDTIPNCDNAAVMAGYTQEIHLACGASELFLLIKPSTDLNTRFKAFDTDNQEWLLVNGWQFSIEE